MGTHSLTYVFGGEEKLVCMYRHFDGYPSGHGAELGNFLKDFTITTGLPPGYENMAIANGPGCLAAQIISHFKVRPGGIYLQSINDDDFDWVDYTYGVHVIEDKILIDIDWGTTLEKCSVEEFLKYCKSDGDN